MDGVKEAMGNRGLTVELREIGPMIEKSGNLWCI